MKGKRKTLRYFVLLFCDTLETITGSICHALALPSFPSCVWQAEWRKSNWRWIGKSNISGLSTGGLNLPQLKTENYICAIIFVKWMKWNSCPFCQCEKEHKVTANAEYFADACVRVHTQPASKTCVHILMDFNSRIHHSRKPVVLKHLREEMCVTIPTHTLVDGYRSLGQLCRWCIDPNGGLFEHLV